MKWWWQLAGSETELERELLNPFRDSVSMARSHRRQGFYHQCGADSRFRGPVAHEPMALETRIYWLCACRPME
jgi:hypothetical protein